MRKICTLMFVVLLLSPFTARAQTVPVDMEWQPNTEANLSGYRIYCSWESGKYTDEFTAVGKVTKWSTVAEQVDQDRTLYCSATAVNTEGLESAKSNESSKVIPSLVAIPPAPLNFTVTKTNSDRTVKLSWDAVQGASSYTLNIHLKGSPYHPCETLAYCGSVGAVTSIEQTLAYGDYDTWVSATMADGTETASRGTAFTIVDPTPKPPQGLILSSVTPDRIVIVASMEHCPRVVTSTRGSNSMQSVRTVRCVQ